MHFSNLHTGPTKEPLTFKHIQAIAKMLNEHAIDDHEKQMKEDILVTVYTDKGFDTLPYRKAFMRYGGLYSIEVDRAKIEELVEKMVEQ